MDASAFCQARSADARLVNLETYVSLSSAFPFLCPWSWPFCDSRVMVRVRVRVRVWLGLGLGLGLGLRVKG